MQSMFHYFEFMTSGLFLDYRSHIGIWQYIEEIKDLRWVNGYCIFSFKMKSNKKCVVLKSNNGEFVNQGVAVNDEKVLKVFGNHEFGGIIVKSDA